ncbi:MAG TPA: metal ABC transporter ATP-binding protein [Candidatus Aquilonibacter sp.]|nr:metal ABC transporter ATP-binding protein [Candidatus Aquilonibacter sp.]
MPDPLLSVTNLFVSFGDRTVIEDLSFTVQAGEGLAVIGPNGAGKTVLLKALLGLIPHSGTIRWSQDARLGYVPQKIEADRQLPLRLRDLLTAKTAVLKLPRTEVAQVTSYLGLTQEILDTSIGHLSGGQFQKALIAFALLGRPNVLLFDEPTASLDELAEERVYEMLHSLQQDKGMTVILVSHDLSVVYRYADMVLCISKGAPCMGPPREVLTPEMLETLYGTPPKYYRHAHGADVPPRNLRSSPE